jgi:hypothetical protein
MKKLAILFVILSIILFSCQRKEVVVEEPEDDFLKIPEYTSEPYKPTYTPSVYTSTTDSTYWYVILSADNVTWHGTVSLGTQYFDFLEARKQFGSAKGKGYFKFIFQISRESIDTYDVYAEKK